MLYIAIHSLLAPWLLHAFVPGRERCLYGQGGAPTWQETGESTCKEGVGKAKNSQGRACSSTFCSYLCIWLKSRQSSELLMSHVSAGQPHSLVPRLLHSKGLSLLVSKSSLCVGRINSAPHHVNHF